MKTKVFILFFILLIPSILHSQIIAKVPNSDVTIIKSEIGTLTEYSLTIYDRNTGYNGEIRLGDFNQAMSLLTKLEDESFRKMGKFELNNGFGDSAEYKNSLSGPKWNIYRQNGQVLYLSLYETKSCKEWIMDDRLMTGSSKVTPSDISITYTERPPSFYFKRSAKRMGWTLGLSAVTALNGAVYYVIAANNAAYGVKSDETIFALFALGTSVASLCTVIGSILDLHRAGSALERIQITSGGVAFKF